MTYEQLLHQELLLARDAVAVAAREELWELLADAHEWLADVERELGREVAECCDFEEEAVA